MNKYFFILNAFKFIIFFNLLTFSKTFNQGSWLAVRQWSQIHLHMLHKLRIKAWVDRKLISIMVPIQLDWSGLVLSAQN